MNSPRPTKNKYYHLVPDNHKCSKCKLGKGVVGFSLSKGKIKPRCNTCDGKSRSPRVKIEKITVSQRFKDYFEEKSYEKGGKND